MEGRIIALACTAQGGGSAFATMPIHKCGSSTLCLHELGGVDADEAGDFEYVEIDPSGRYGRYKEVLGRGAFKTVYRAFDQEDGIEVAWNQVQDVLLRTQEDLDRLYSEVHLLSQLKHKNIMKLYHSWVDKKAHTVNFITEIFTSGTLRQYRKRHKHVDIKAVKNWSRQILRGLLYLHSHDPPIIHRDLKCDNIFINGNHGEVKIGDLGLAAILQHAHARSVIGTPEFMAPELYEEEYTELVDIYSFGMCLLEMVTSQYPYSECSNAAQIYRKVMQGKRPEALKLVKDQELCQFIEKCLAPASRRLPARELLIDPFLQCEASQSTLESSPLVGRTVWRAMGMDDAEVVNEETHAISATVQISYVMKETRPAFVHDGSEVCGCLVGDAKGAQSVDLKIPQIVELASSQFKEDRARSVDFRVDGKRREDDNVFLKLRISGSEGQVRNIHFPFDVQHDTAMCVASEMVAELDLTDQDVTKIAEMIDVAIVALVPEWIPGVAIDETCCEGETTDIEGGNGTVNVFDPVSLSESLLEDTSPSKTEMIPPSRVEGLVYGRFEEVTYQCHRSEFPAIEIEQCTEPCTVSSDTSDTIKEAEWSLSDSSSSHTCQMLVSAGETAIPVLEQPSHTDTRGSQDESDVGNAFNELVEFNRKSGCANFVHKILEGLVHGHSCGDSNTTLAPALLQEEDECDEETERELAELILRHEQEKLELQQKHEEALAEVRRRSSQRRKNMNCKDGDDSSYPLDGKVLASSYAYLKAHGSPPEIQRNVHCEYGSFNGSMTSLEDFSSMG